MAIHCRNQYWSAIIKFCQLMGLFQRIADIMHHKNTEGHNRCIFFLYQLEKTSFLFSNPIINKKPETKKNSAFPCTPKVANDGDISLYKGIK